MRVPISPASLYGVYISQLICFTRASSHVTDFNTRNKLLTQKLLEPTNDIYAVLLQGSGKCLRFRFRKANILFAFLVILVRWGSHLRSSDIKIPK